MTQNSFTQEDLDKLIEFLNMISDKAEFKLNTEEVIAYFKLLSHMQQNVLPKVRNHILEVKKITKPKDENRTGD